MAFDNTFVISLPNRHDRLKAFQTSWRDFMANVTVVRALRVSREDRYVMKALKHKRSSTGAVGCYLSHLRLLEQIRDLRLTSALVLEDDAHLTAANTFKSSIRDANKFKWDMLYFGYNNLGTPPYTCTKKTVHWCKVRGTVSDMVAYAVNRRSVSRIVNHLQKKLLRNTTLPPIDLALWTLQPTLNVYITFPRPVVVQRDRFKDSDITFYAWSRMHHRPDE